MNVSILMVTYHRDAAWAFHSLRSIEKYCTGFSDVTVMVPHGDVLLFRRLTNFRVLGFTEIPGKGMLCHQAEICQADLTLPHADAVLHIDADICFWKHVTPTDFFVDGKPIWYRERYEDFREKHPTRYGWKDAVHKATGIDPEWETMVRHCSVILRETYPIVRALIENRTGMNWRDYIISCENSYPQSFAEFPSAGAVAIAHMPEKYHWVDWVNEGRDYVYDREKDPVIAMWSHASLDEVTDRHPGRTAREVIEEILK